MKTKFKYLVISLSILSFTGSTLAQCVAIPGDANGNGTITLGDVISVVNYVFNKPGCTPQPTCWLSGLLCRGDVNGDGNVTLADVICLLNFKFYGASLASGLLKPCPSPPIDGCCCTPQPTGTCCLPVPGCP